VPYEASRGAGVWFVDTEAEARRFGDVVLRFPWPKGAVKTDVFAQHGFYWRTPGAVDDVSTIGVRLEPGARWEPLGDFYNVYYE
jgi:hypothetical protein